MSDILLTIPEIDERIAAIRENLRELIEQATAYSGAADEELASERIAEQEEELERLMKRRDELSKQKS
jgi:predicted  nucleic acid-binding Zn-ribbon protein